MKVDQINADIFEIQKTFNYSNLFDVSLESTLTSGNDS